MTNLGNLDRIRHDQRWLAEGRFFVTILGNLDRIRHDQRWLAAGGFSVTNLGWASDEKLFQRDSGK